MRVVMVGLDASGKTTILYRLAFGDTVKTLPTGTLPTHCAGKGSPSHSHLILSSWFQRGDHPLRQAQPGNVGRRYAVNCCTPSLGCNSLTAFTVSFAGGQKKLRQLWQYYLKNTHALIFVVDSSDVTRMQEARLELEDLMMRPEMAGGLLLVLANKQDLPTALPPDQVSRALRLKKIARKGKWHVQGTIGTTGNGLYEAIDWLATSLRERYRSSHRKKTTWRFVWDNTSNLDNVGSSDDRSLVIG